MTSLEKQSNKELFVKVLLRSKIKILYLKLALNLWIAAQNICAAYIEVNSLCDKKISNQCQWSVVSNQWSVIKKSKIRGSVPSV